MARPGCTVSAAAAVAGWLTQGRSVFDSLGGSAEAGAYRCCYFYLSCHIGWVRYHRGLRRHAAVRRGSADPRPHTRLSEGSCAGRAGSVADVLSGSADKPIGRQDVTITRTDEFGALPVDVGAKRTTSQGMFGPISNTPANRGKNTYQVSFAGDKDFAAAQRRVSARSTAPPPR